MDIAKNGFQFTNSSHGVRFDILADGTAKQVSWTTAGSDDAFLVLDRNGNGSIDDATELFGDRTPQPADKKPNGFEALRVLDSNADGVISDRDSLYGILRLWTDRNHNGVSEASELGALADRGVQSIALDYRESRRTDPHGNVFRYRAKVEGPVGPFAYDVYLVIAGLPTTERRE